MMKSKTFKQKKDCFFRTVFLNVVFWNYWLIDQTEYPFGGH